MYELLVGIRSEEIEKNKKDEIEKKEMKNQFKL